MSACPCVRTSGAVCRWSSGASNKDEMQHIVEEAHKVQGQPHTAEAPPRLRSVRCQSIAS